MFKKITAIMLFVQNFDVCLKFYRDTLGLEVAHLEPKFAAFRIDDQDLAIAEVSEGAAVTGTDEAAFEPQTGKLVPGLLCVRVENVDAAYETFKSRGVEFTKPPVDQPWGIRAAYFRDPEGNVWEILQPLASS